MSLKARLKRLEAEVEWLGIWGALRVAELKFELPEKKKEIGDFLADHPEKAAYLASIGVTCVKPTPRPPPRPSPPPVSASPPEPAAVEPLPPPASMLALLGEARPAPEPPPQAPEAHDVPEHMQIRPVRWVLPADRYRHVEPHTPEDEDYDPFAAFYDD
jgi:hypothetical protein